MLVQRRSMHCVIRSFFIFVTSIFACVANAATVTDLYEVTMPIEQSRDTAFVEALKAVAVKVSGRRDAGARLGPAASSPRQYVQRFAFTLDNQLQVAFDSGSVDRLLSDAGLPIWGRERPATLVLVSVPGPDGSPNWLDVNFAAGEREAIAKSARLRGLPIVWPSLTPQDRSMLASASAGSSAELLELATRSNANAVLFGHARRDGAGALSVQWNLFSQEGAANAGGSLDEGIHLAADTLGRVYATAGGTVGAVAIEIAGIRNLDDYASTLNYLEGMTLVRSVALEQVTGDTMRLQLAVRGDASTLRRALALDSRLVAAGGGETPGDRLQFRLNR